MKPTSHLVNLARGGVVDETALAEGESTEKAEAEWTAEEPAEADGMASGRRLAAERLGHRVLDGRPLLEGRTIVLTGAAGGIGRVLAEALVCAGARLAITDVAEGALDELRAVLAGPVAALGDPWRAAGVSQPFRRDPRCGDRDRADFPRRSARRPIGRGPAYGVDRISRRALAQLRASSLMP